MWLILLAIFAFASPGGTALDASTDVAEPDAAAVRVRAGPAARSDASVTATATQDAGADAPPEASFSGFADANVVDAQAADARTNFATADAASEVSATERPPPTVSETRPAPIATQERKDLAIHTVLGLLALLVLAYVANHPSVERLQRALRVRSVIAAGFPFVALGLLARLPAVGILPDRVLIGLTPLVEFGLGWIGFLVGFKLDVRALDQLPRAAATVALIFAMVPFIAIAVVCSALMFAMGIPYGEGLFLRSAIVLGVAGAMSAPSVLQIAADRGQADVNAHWLDEFVGIVGLAFVAAYFRPPIASGAWNLPGTAWLFLTLGMGATLGLVLYLILRRPTTESEFVAIAIGSIAFAAGMAAYLNLSPLVICFISGAVIANLPNARREAFAHSLKRFERPIFIVFLVLAGALWEPRDWRGWALLPAFLVSRYFGLWLGSRIAIRRAPEASALGRPRSAFVAPLSVIAIAVVINVRTLYQGPIVPIMITAVLSGALIAELVAAVADRGATRAEPDP